MKWGAVFPQVEIGNDPSAIRDFAQGAEELGFDYLLAYEHVLGVDPAHYPEQSFIYTHKDPFHEPFVLFAYLAAVTRKIEFVTGIMILPQRDVRLVAKQAAELALLSGGRFRLGLGAGWNRPEATNLGTDFATRGKRMDEQLTVLKKLWTEPLVDYQGQFHQLHRCGLNPLPPNPPEVWIGGSARPVLRRAAKHAAGWIPATLPQGQERSLVEELRSRLEAEGRDPNDFGLDARVVLARTEQGKWADTVEFWRCLGATHFRCNTMGLGLASVGDHLGALEQFLQEVR